MSIYSVDIEADGPIPGDYSMTEIGAVVIAEHDLKQGKLELPPVFHAFLRPLPDASFDKKALAVSGYTREETLTSKIFRDPNEVMMKFTQWVMETNEGKAMFLSDGPFDWMFVCWYLHHFTKDNPFGHSGLSLTSMYKGVVRDMRKNHKRLRRTPHTHNALDDAKGNAEAFVTIVKNYDVVVPASILSSKTETE